MSPSTSSSTVPVPIGETACESNNDVDVDRNKIGINCNNNNNNINDNNNEITTNGSNIQGNHKTRAHIRSKSPVLKRVSFGSSKGSMVETLIYDHSEEDLLKDRFSNNSSSERYLNGNHISHYNQPIHFHYPIGRRLGSRVASDSTISGSLTERPSRVRVSLYESGRPGLILTQESPESSASSYQPSFTSHSTSFSRTHNGHSSSIGPSNHLSSSSHQSSHHHLYHPSDHLTLNLVKTMERKDSVDSGIENPFRPGGELSREAETIVNLIKEGKPITPTTPTKELPGLSDRISNGTPVKSTGVNDESSKVSAKNALNVQSSPESQLILNGKQKKELNGTPKMNGNGSSPAVVEVQRSIVTPTEPPKAHIVTIKRKSKCACCVIQ